MAASRPPTGRCSKKGATTCCYARSEKSWIADPDGVVWETFLTNGEATVYGDSPALARCPTDAARDEPAARRRMPAAEARPSAAAG